MKISWPACPVSVSASKNGERIRVVFASRFLSKPDGGVDLMTDIALETLVHLFGVRGMD